MVKAHHRVAYVCGFSFAVYKHTLGANLERVKSDPIGLTEVIVNEQGLRMSRGMFINHEGVFPPSIYAEMFEQDRIEVVARIKGQAMHEGALGSEDSAVSFLFEVKDPVDLTFALDACSSGVAPEGVLFRSVKLLSRKIVPWPLSL